MSITIHEDVSKSRYGYETVSYVDPHPGKDDHDVVGERSCERCGGSGRMPYTLDGGRCWGECEGLRGWSRPVFVIDERKAVRADVRRQNRARRAQVKADFKWSVFVEQVTEAGYGAWSRALSSENDFVESLVAQVRSGKLLTDKQIIAGHDAILRDEQRAEERVQRDAAKAELQPLAEGRRELTGTILKTELRESNFGTSWKMLLELPGGYRVWGTVPNAIFDGADGEVEHGKDLVGLQIQLTARVERSIDDHTFGFLSRPTKASRIS